VSLEAKRKDSLSSEPCSKLALHQKVGPRNNIVWELYYHRNLDFESIIGTPVSGSDVTLIFDTSSTWRISGGKVIAVEGKAGMYQNHPGHKVEAECTKLPRIDMSEGLNQRFIDLIVACWVAKAYSEWDRQGREYAR
jgi:hypothetical protein